MRPADQRLKSNKTACYSVHYGLVHKMELTSLYRPAHVFFDLLP
jgi:hypothetical protein